MSKAHALVNRLIIGVYMDRARVMKRIGAVKSMRDLVTAARRRHRELIAAGRIDAPAIIRAMWD
jgi:hypothetical protein